MLERFDVVAILPASDLQRARRWYEEKLGFTPFEENDEQMRYRSGSAEFDVYRTQYAGTAKNTCGGWYVEDVDAAVDELRGRGVEFHEYDFPGLKTVNGIAHLGYERAAWFTDSEGNILSVSQLTAAG